MGLTVVITGAAGYVGRACVEQALRRGHRVRAVVRRPAADLPPEVEQTVCDLAKEEAPLIRALEESDVVIHCAAAMSGDADRARHDTLLATNTLLSAMSRAAPAARLVLVSSIAVYDASETEIDEFTPLDPDPARRDGYARAKLGQEALLTETTFEGWIARPGAVYGPGRLWNAHLGHRVGPVFLRLGNGAAIPVVGRGACAEALIRAAETPPPGGGMRPVNLVESDLPDARRYLAALGPAAPRLQLPVPWQVLATVGHLIGLVPALRDRRPGLLQPRTLRFRFGRKRFSNARAGDELHWHPRQPLENVVDAARPAMGEAGS